MLTIVQPAGQTYLAFEAEHPEGVITDLDGDGASWAKISGPEARGLATAPSGGGAIKALDNAGQITYPIQLTTGGPYFFYARTKYSGGGDNSMFVPPNGGPINADPSPQWDNNAEALGDYHWATTNNAATVFSWTNPTPGQPTTFKLNIREASYFVDRIVLSQTEMTPDQLDAITPQIVQLLPAPYPDLNGITINYGAVPDATGYSILRGTSATGPFAPVTGAQNLTELTFTDDTLPANSAGQTFWYVVDTATPAGTVRSTPVSIVAGTGLLATHYETRFFQDNPDNDTDPHVRTDSTLDENWGDIGPDFLVADPSAPDADDTWSIAFNGRLRPNATGEYTFYTGSDDGIEIQIVDPDTGNVILSGPTGGIQFLRGIAYPYQEVAGKVTLTAGKMYPIQVKWSENGGGAAWRVAWSGPNTQFQAIPNDVLYRPDTTVVPNSPSGLIARPRNDGALLSWVDRANNETGYLVERKVGSGAFTQIADLPAETTSYTDTGLTLGQVVTYRVRAKNATGNSAYSNEATVTVGGSGGTGLLAKHYETRFFEDNPDSTNDPIIDHDSTLDMNWGGEGPTFLEPDPTSVDPDDTWSIVFTGQVQAEFSENYTFYTGSDDGIELTIIDPATGTVLLSGPPNGIQFLRGIGYPYQDVVGTIPLEAGKKYDIQVRWSENGGGAAWRVAWSSPSIPFEPIPDLQLFEPVGTQNVRPAQRLAASVMCSDRVSVSWVDASLGETGSILQRATNQAGPWTDVVTLGPDQNTEFTDLGPTGGFAVNTDYFYRVVTNGPGGPVNSQVLTAHTYDGSTVTDTRLQLNGTAKFLTVPVTTDADGQILQLTDNVNDQSGTAFLKVARDVDHDWSSSFDFQIPERSGSRADGFTFMIQSNNPNVVGGGGGGFAASGIPNSLAVKFDIYPNAQNQTGVYLNGSAGTDDGVDIGFDIANGHKYRATLVFDSNYVEGSDDDQILLKIEDLTDPSVTPYEVALTAAQSGATFDISTVLGSCAYIGFTGATGGENAEQNILNWTIDNDGPNGPGAPQVIPLPGTTQVTVAHVTKVFVNGPNLTNATTGNAAWRGAAGADANFGYPIPDGGNQTRPIPWSSGVNKVSIQFDTDVASVLDQGDLVVRGTNANPTITAFTYDPTTKTGTWTLGTTVQLDKLRLVLDDAGFPATGNIVLDGDWTNPSVLTPNGDTYPSGDNTVGGDFNFRINVLRGDSNGDQAVNALDVADIKKRLLRRPGDGVTGSNAYSIFADLNADGVINALDVAAVKTRLNTRINTLPEPATALLFA